MSPVGPGAPGGPDGERHFGFRDGSSETPTERPDPLPPFAPSTPGDGPPPGPQAPPFELGWFLAIITGFGGSIVGGLLGFPGAPMLGAALAFVPLWLRIVRGGRTSAAALAAVAWMVGCVAAGAGLGAEGLDARFAGSIPLAPAYLRLAPLAEDLPLEGLARWRSAVPAVLGFWLIAGLGRFAQGLPAVLAASVPATWMAARAARFTDAALTREWDASTAFLLSAAPQHLFVLGGALAVAAVLGSPRADGRVPDAGTAERRVWLAGLAAGLVGVLGEPWLDAIWRSSAAL